MHITETIEGKLPKGYDQNQSKTLQKFLEIKNNLLKVPEKKQSDRFL